MVTWETFQELFNRINRELDKLTKELEKLRTSLESLSKTYQEFKDYCETNPYTKSKL